MTQLTILQANFLKSNHRPVWDHRLLLSQGADLVGINEGRHFCHLFKNSPGYRAAIPHKYGARQNNPILVSNRLKWIKFTAHDMCAGVGKSPPRTATVAYYELDGVRRAHIQTHANAHIELNHRPRGLPRVFQDVVHMRRLIKLVRRLRREGYKVTVAGDFNWDFRPGTRGWFYSPKRVFKRLGMVVNWATPTAPRQGSLGSRQVDYIAFDPHDLVPVAQRWVKGEHSDHRWLLATFDVRGS